MRNSGTATSRHISVRWRISAGPPPLFAESCTSRLKGWSPPPHCARRSRRRDETKLVSILFVMYKTTRFESHVGSRLGDALPPMQLRCKKTGNVKYSEYFCLYSTGRPAFVERQGATRHPIGAFCVSGGRPPSRPLATIAHRLLHPRRGATAIRALERIRNRLPRPRIRPGGRGGSRRWDSRICRRRGSLAPDQGERPETALPRDR